MKPARFVFWPMIVFCLAAMQTKATVHTFQLVTNAAFANWWPYDTNLTDLGFIGIPDNVVSNGLAPGSGSAPNVHGCYSYIDMDAHSVVAQANTYSFLEGQVGLDDAGLLDINIALISSAHLTGTEPYPGHGPLLLDLVRQYDSSVSFETNELRSNGFYFSATVDFQDTLPAGVVIGTNALIPGFAILLSAPQFATNLPPVTPDPDDPTPAILAEYINSVVLPLARQRQPAALVCIACGPIFDGTDPNTNPYIPPLWTSATFVGFEFPSGLAITAVSRGPAGVQLQWTSLTGKVYRVEWAASPAGQFQTLVDNLSGTQYLDTTAGSAPARFYRVAAH